MGKHSKDWNNTPTDPKASPEQKAREFDKQYEQNRSQNPSKTPALDEYKRKQEK